MGRYVAALCLWLLLVGLQGVLASISSGTVTLASQAAGAASAASVTFTSSAEVAVGSFVIANFPAGFQVSASASLTVSAANSASSLAITSITTTQVVATVETGAIAADTAFTYVVSEVTNPAAGDTATFSIVIQDSNGAELDTATVDATTIVSTAFSAASVTLDSTDAGVTGTATVAFTTDAALPVGSVLIVTFPSELLIASTSALSSLSSLDSASTVLIDSGSIAKVVVAGSALTASSAVSFKLDGVTNPGATTTGTFALVSTDSAGGEFQYARDISAAVISSTPLQSVTLSVSSSLAGVAALYELSVQLAVAIPVGGSLSVVFPSDFSLANLLTLADVNAHEEVAATADGTKVSFLATSEYSTGLYTLSFDQVQNPGVSTTGLFNVFSTDANGLLLESGTCNGVAIVPGAMSDAAFVPVLAHPGIVSRVTITFTTSSALFPDDFLHIQLPTGEYAPGVPHLSVSVSSHPQVSATAEWDAPTTSMLILLTGTTFSIASGTAIILEVTALQTPPSIRSEHRSAIIQSWNSKGLQLDGPSDLYVSAITAVQNLECTWLTSTTKPGVRSDATITFAISGELPAGGTIAVALPVSDFSAESAGNSPAVVFDDPATVAATSVWVANDNVLLITVDSPIPAYTSPIIMRMLQLNTPPSVRPASRALATLTTFDSLGVEIDGPSVIQLDAIVAGLIQGSRIWAPVNAVAGVTSDQRVSFTTNGRVLAGGSLNFVLPDVGWALAVTGLATFETPPLGAVGSTTWDASTRTLTVTLAANTVLLAATQVVLLIPGVTNPPKEAGGNLVYLETRSAEDGSTIDGPGAISTLGISCGKIGGLKTWTSVSTTSPSMRSDQVLRMTLSGSLPSGSSIRAALSDSGWRTVGMVTSVDVSFTIPPSGVLVSTAVWDPDTSSLVIETQGDLDAASEVELLIKDIMNPYATEPATTCSIRTFLADGGVVDESSDIEVNAIVASDLPAIGSWTSAVDSPGVTSTQTIRLQIGGQLGTGARICVTLHDDWEVMYGAEASIIVSDSANTVTSPATLLSLSWAPPALCFQTSSDIEQESNVVIEVTKMRTPSSVRVQTLAPVFIQSHTGGAVNQGFLQVPPFVAGALTGPLTWQSTHYSPGAVAGMLTSAQLAFQTTGRIPLGGQIRLMLPSSWTLSATCSASFNKPALLATASCSDQQLIVSVMDDIAAQTDIEIVVNNINNPDAIMSAELASCETIAPNGGGFIDRTDAVTTNPVSCILTDVSSAGNHLVAVVGVTKTFSFVGSLIAANDVVKFVDASTSSDANCGDMTTGRSDAGGLDITQVSSALDVSLQFSHASPVDKPFALCYKFGGNPFKLYHDFSITVKAIESITATDGDADITVASHLKTWVFGGSGLAQGDLIRWIDAEVVDDPASVLSPPSCLDTSTLAELDPSEGGGDADSYTRSAAVEGSSAQVSLAFSESTSGKSYCLCYKFGDEPFVVYSTLRIRVRHLLSIEAADGVGSDFVAVVDASKRFNLVGDGMQLNDRLYFIRVGSALSCEASAADPSLRLSHTVAGQTLSLLFVDTKLSATVSFSSSAAGVLAMLCYQFGNEPFHLYPIIKVDVKMVTAYTGMLGRASLAVADVPEPLTFLGFGVSEGDAVRWTRRGDDFCDSNLASLTELSTMDPIDTVTLGADVSAPFNFTADQTDYAPILCYRFGDEPFQRYPGISITIATLYGKTAAVGAKDVAVASARKTFVLSGVNMAPGDRLGWTFDLSNAEPCANLSLLLTPTVEEVGADASAIGTDYLSVALERSSSSSAEFSVALAPINSGRRVYLCYGFGDEPLKLFQDMFLDIKSILNVRALLGSQAVAVAGERKTFLFDGDGVASGDFAKFVGTNDCSAPGVTLLNVMKEFDDIDDMAMYIYHNGAGVSLGNFQFSTASDSAGLSRTLCYRFGSEPYKNYNEFSIDIKTIWEITKYSTTAPARGSTAGSDSVAVVNEPKLMAFGGVGVSAEDDLKFVDATASLFSPSDESTTFECDALPAQGLIGRELVIADNLTSWFHFDYGSNSSAWLLCYKFAGERFRLYPSVRLIVKEVTAILDFDFPEENTLGHVATIGHVKKWRVVASGAGAGDRAKFVAQNVQSSDECGVDDANVASGSTVMTVLSSSAATNGTFFFSGTFNEYPVTAEDVYSLCYKFQDEPFSLIRGFSLKTYGLASVDRSVALVDAAMTYQLTGLRLSRTDQLSWTSSAASCNSMVLNPVPVSDLLTASLLFLKSYTKLYLCYSFDRQPFDVFRSFTLIVVNADVWSPQTIAIVADQTTQLDVAGTFGITDSSDQIAWIPSDSLACSSDAVAAYASTMASSILAVVKANQASAPLSGSASFSVRYTAPLSSTSSSRSALSTWKLCYRFGAMANYLMFGDVLVDVMNIDQIQLRRRSTSSLGSVLTFQFDGQGLRDFDVAKWIRASDAESDADCASLPAVGGSSPSNVINQRATFTFTEQSVGGMALCYQFQGRAYKLFKSVSVIDSSVSTSSSQSSTSKSTGATTISADMAEEQAAVNSEQIIVNRDVATIKLTLEKDIAEIPVGSAAEATFITGFVDALATSLGVDPARIRITALVAGSVIVEFELSPSSSAGDATVSEIVDDLQAQVLNPNSALRAAAGITIKDPPSAALSVTVVTTPASSTPESSTFLQALGYQRNGLFSFVKSVYSVTEKSESISIPIIREQGVGSDNSVILMVQLEAGATATYGQDYRFASTLMVSETDGGIPESLFVRFEPGDVVKEITIEILSDSVKEAHFEAFTLALVAPETPSAALGNTKTVTVRIYDYDEGSPLGTWHFSTDIDEIDRLLGWQVVGNGDAGTESDRTLGGQLRVDTNGAFAVDAVVGEREYNQACDLAAPTGECTFDCEVGADLKSMATINAAYRALRLDGDDYVASTRGIDAFPTSAITISLWVRTTQADPNACLLSYAASSSPSSTPWAAPLALCNPSSLELSINAGSRARALSTFLNVSDGSWHFLALTWNADDGRVSLFDNGMLAFSGGPYRTDSSLPQGGTLVLGQLVLSSPAPDLPCSSAKSSTTVELEDATSYAVTESDAGGIACRIADGASGFVGDVQHVHVWSRRLSRSELLKELSWPPTPASSNALVLGWSFDAANLDLISNTVADFAIKGQNVQYPGFIHCVGAACVTPGIIPSIHSAFPCGSVYANVWHFAAPETLVAKLPLAYGGRLQFRMLAPSSNGSPRARRGRLSVLSDGGSTRMSLSLGSFALPGRKQWTFYSAVLREDFAWVDEPSGGLIERGEFRRRLAVASAMWIRGDLWGHATDGTGGLGQEVVYLNDVTLFAR